jgi:hypothetical protein
VFVLAYISSLLKSSKGEDGSKSKGITIRHALRHRRRLLFRCPLKQHALGERLR